MKKVVVSLMFLVFVTQGAMADYILTSTDGWVARYSDTFSQVWTTSVTAAQSVVVDDDGEVYVALGSTQYIVKHLSYADGSYVGRVVPTIGATVNVSGGGTWTVPTDGSVGSLTVRDISFYDYNGDGVKDLYVSRSDSFEIYDGTTLNGTGDSAYGTLLARLYVADSSGEDGTGSLYGIAVASDGTLYATKGNSTASNSRLNIWDSTLTVKVGEIDISGSYFKDNDTIIIGADINGNGSQDLWVLDSRNNRIKVWDGSTGELLDAALDWVSADGTLSGDQWLKTTPTDIEILDDGTILNTTRFASTLDSDWTGTSEVTGGNLLSGVWDATQNKLVLTLLYESTTRLDGVAYVPEPATLVSLSLGALLLRKRRK